MLKNIQKHFKFLFLLFIAQTTLASIPYSYSILEQIASQRSKIGAIYIKNRVLPLARSSQQSEGLPVFYEWLEIDYGKGKLISQLQSESGLPLYSVTRDLSMRAAALDENSVLNFIEFAQNGNQISEALRHIKIKILSENQLYEIPIHKERQIADGAGIKRWNDKVAWVLGAEKNSDKLWVEKDTFLPLRLIWQGKEAQWSNPKNKKSFWYAEETQILKNDAPYFSVKVEDIEVFDEKESKATSRLKQKSIVNKIWAPAAQTLSEAQRDLILEYFEVLR